MATAAKHVNPEQRGLAFSLTIQDKFETFHGSNPWVFDEIVREARDLRDMGFSNYGIKAIFEVIRWRRARTTRSADGWKLNNILTSRYARAIEAECPDLHGFFRTRELKAS